MKAIANIPGIRGILPAVMTLAFLTLPLFSSGQTVVDVLKKQPQLKSFAGAVEHAGMVQQLSQEGPFTIFAPADESFSSVYNTQNQGNPAKLKRIILNHMITGMATKKKLKMMNNIPTLGGLNLKMEVNENGLLINKAQIIHSNIKASNGVIHIIDRMLQ